MLPMVVVMAVSCGGAPDAPMPDATSDAVPAADSQLSAGVIERLDPAFDALVPLDAVIEHLADGFAFTEGPV